MSRKKQTKPSPAEGGAPPDITDYPGGTTWVSEEYDENIRTLLGLKTERSGRGGRRQIDDAALIQKVRALLAEDSMLSVRAAIVQSAQHRGTQEQLEAIIARVSRKLRGDTRS